VSKAVNIFSCPKANTSGDHEKWHSLVDLDKIYTLAKLLGLLNLKQSISHKSHDNSTLQRGKLSLAGTSNHTKDIPLVNRSFPDFVAEKILPMPFTS